MRNTCDSSKTASTAWFSLRAESRSVPNGFSMITRARSVARPEVPSMPTTEVNATGGIDRWNSRRGGRSGGTPPPRAPADLLLRLLHRGHQRRGVVGIRGGERQPLGERRPGRVGGLGDAEVGARLLGE